MSPREEIEYLLRYEMAASDWWVSSISVSWMQSLAAHYFCWKVKRKLAALRRTERRALRVEVARRVAATRVASEVK